MKKLFAILGISALTFCACLGTPKPSSSFVYAQDESSQPISSSEQEQTSSENENDSSEEEKTIINVDEEISKISDSAKDTIEIIKTIFSQEIVIAGVSLSFGAIFMWLIGKVVVSVFSKRKDKYEKKQDELLKQLGYKEQEIKELKEQVDNLEEIIKEIIKNMKNAKVKDELLKLLDGVLEKAQEDVDDVVEDIKENVETSSDKIRELLEK